MNNEEVTDPLQFLRSASQVGLVLGGGSIRCAFQVGVIEALEELGIRPAMVIGVSGGSWNAAAVAARQTHRLRYYWRAFCRMPAVDLRNLLRDHSPFIWNRIHERTFSSYVGRERLRSAESLPLYIAVTRLRDRSSVLFDARSVDDPLQLMLASNYLFPFYTHAPRIGGERYGDGGLSNNIPYESAFAAGCDAVILVSVKGESEGPLFRNPREVAFRIPEEDARRMVVIRPRHRLPFGFVERKKESVEKLIHLGYLRTREILLNERHGETDLKAAGRAPSMIVAQLLGRTGSPR